MQRVLITGASSGIGKAFAETFHARGDTVVVLVARRKELLAEIAASMNDKRQESVVVLEADLTTASDIEKVCTYIAAHPIDILINNAGFGSFGAFETLPVSRELAMVRLNCEAPLHLSNAVISQMKQKRQGAIINLSSVAGFQPLPYMATYSATKVFDLWHSLALWAELKRFNVHVLAVCPGPTATEFGGVARVPGTIAATFRDPVQLVIDQSLRALDRKIPIVVTGMRSKCMAFASRYLPLSLTTLIVGWQLRKVLITARG